eukprot:scaffold5039_cov255-Pinguiococcus_pyrenoidosus.AAC.3
MSLKNDFLAAAGLRADGRRPHEVRRCVLTLGASTHEVRDVASRGLLEYEVDGAAYFELGQTKVLACVVGPREPSQRSRNGTEEASIHCDFRIAPFAGTNRKVRRPEDRKITEYRMAMEKLFDSVIMTELYPRAQIDIVIQVFQMDGSPLSACINAASSALMEAGIAMQDTVTACTAGYLDSTIVLDMNHLEKAGDPPEVGHEPDDDAAFPGMAVADRRLSHRLPLRRWRTPARSCSRRSIARCPWIRSVICWQPPVMDAP